MSFDLVTDFFTTGSEESVTFTHNPGVSQVVSTIKVHFNNPYAAAKMQGLEAASSLPTALCKTSDVSTAVARDTLTISSVVYYIVDIQPDGTGLTLLILSKD